MSTSTISGKNFQKERSCITFFDTTGACTSDGSWLHKSPKTFGIMFEVEPDTKLLPAIQYCIDTDVKNGHGEDIAMLQVIPTVGVSLVLLGIITDDNLRHAQEYDTYIDIPDVHMPDHNIATGYRTLNIRIDPNSSYIYATTDKDGNVL